MEKPFKNIFLFQLILKLIKQQTISPYHNGGPLLLSLVWFNYLR